MLFEDPARRSSSVGVTVSPVRVASIAQFGDLAAVGQRLLDVERKKVRSLVVVVVVVHFVLHRAKELVPPSASLCAAEARCGGVGCRGSTVHCKAHHPLLGHDVCRTSALIHTPCVPDHPPACLPAF